MDFDVNGDAVQASTVSARAVARVVAVCAVLAGLFLMHGLATQECHGRAGTSASSMTHPMAAMPATVDGIGTSVETTAHTSLNRSSVHVTSTSGADAGAPGGLCVSTPPTSGVAVLLALLLAAGSVVLASAAPPANQATPQRNHRRRAPPVAGSALLMNLCVSRT